MPTYEYQCKACDHEFERDQRISDPPVKTCPRCKARQVKRLISRTSFHLKGGGWYSDLYSKPKGGAKQDGDAKPDSGSKADSKADSKSDKSDSKSDSKSGSGSKSDVKPASDAPAKSDSGSGSGKDSGGSGSGSKAAA